MSEVAQTIEGWYALHDFRSIDWSLWRNLSAEERKQAEDEYAVFVRDWARTEENKQGSTAIYNIVGQKADIVFMHLRASLEELAELENQFNKSAFAQYTYPVYSYVSVVELSN